MVIRRKFYFKATALHRSVTSLANVLVSTENNRNELLNRDEEEGEITEEGDGMGEDVRELAKRLKQMNAELAQKDLRILHSIEDNPIMSLTNEDLEGMRIQITSDTQV